MQSYNYNVCLKTRTMVFCVTQELFSYFKKGVPVPKYWLDLILTFSIWSRNKSENFKYGIAAKVVHNGFYVIPFQYL